MVTAMNRYARDVIWFNLVISLLLTGCFGGQAPPIRSDSQQRAELAITRGIRAEQKGSYAEADTYLAEALTISSSIEYDPTRTAALINLARLHRRQRDLPQAELYLNQALAHASSDSLFTAELAHEKALLELAKGNPAKALEWSTAAIAAERGNQLGSRRNLASRIQLALGKTSEAEAQARRALEENRSAGQAEEEANSLRILGVVARNGQKYAEGGQFLQEALSIDKRLGKSAKIAADLEELAITSQNAGQLHVAAGYLERACEVNRAAGRVRQAAQNQQTLASLYTALGETDKAITARAAAQRLADQNSLQLPQKSSATISPSSSP